MPHPKTRYPIDMLSKQQISYTGINVVGTKGKAYTTAIPAAIRLLFDIHEKDVVGWYVNLDTGKIELEVWAGLSDDSSGHHGPRELLPVAKIKLEAVRHEITKLKDLDLEGKEDGYRLERLRHMMLERAIKELKKDFLPKNPKKKKSNS